MFFKMGGRTRNFSKSQSLYRGGIYHYELTCCVLALLRLTAVRQEEFRDGGDKRVTPRTLLRSVLRQQAVIEGKGIPEPV